MIAIVNIEQNPRKSGEHEYSVRINRLEICRFKHHREQNLSTCLEKAAKAVRHHELTSNMHLLAEFTKTCA